MILAKRARQDFRDIGRRRKDSDLGAACAAYARALDALEFAQVAEAELNAAEKGWGEKEKKAAAAAAYSGGQVPPRKLSNNEKSNEKQDEGS